MSNPYVQVGVGLLLIGLCLVVFAFCAALAGATISSLKTVIYRERMKRLKIQADVFGQDAHEDDMK